MYLYLINCHLICKVDRHKSNYLKLVELANVEYKYTTYYLFLFWKGCIVYTLIVNLRIQRKCKSWKTLFSLHFSLRFFMSQLDQYLNSQLRVVNRLKAIQSGRSLIKNWFLSVLCAVPLHGGSPISFSLEKSKCPLHETCRWDRSKIWLSPIWDFSKLTYLIYCVHSDFYESTINIKHAHPKMTIVV